METALHHVAQHLESRTETPDDEAPLQPFITLPTLAPAADHLAELGKRGEPSVVTDEMVCNRLALKEAGLGIEAAAEQSVLLLSAMVDALLPSRSVKVAELSDHLLKTTKRLLTEQAQHTGAK